MSSFRLSSPIRDRVDDKFAELVDSYSYRMEHELSLNDTQSAHATQILSDLLDEVEKIEELAIVDRGAELPECPYIEYYTDSEGVVCETSMARAYKQAQQEMLERGFNIVEVKE